MRLTQRVLSRPAPRAQCASRAPTTDPASWLSRTSVILAVIHFRAWVVFTLVVPLLMCRLADRLLGSVRLRGGSRDREFPCFVPVQVDTARTATDPNNRAVDAARSRAGDRPGLTGASSSSRRCASAASSSCHAKVSMTQDRHMSRGRLRTEIAELLDRATKDE